MGVYPIEMKCIGILVGVALFGCVSPPVKLAEFMFEHNVGCSTTQTYHIKKLETDYFEEMEQNET